MEIRPVIGNPDVAQVRFDSRLEEELFNPHQYQLAARNILTGMHIIPPREYPYTSVFSMEALYQREEEIHARNCPNVRDFSPVVREVRMQLHDVVLKFGEQLRAVGQENWPVYDR